MTDTAGYAKMNEALGITRKDPGNRHGQENQKTEMAAGGRCIEKDRKTRTAEVTL